MQCAELAGLFLDDWQQFVLRNAMGERPDGGWAAKTVGLCVGRQNGKNSILEARELFGLFVLGERLILHTAHLQTTASEQFRRLLELIEGVPEFSARMKKPNRGKGSEAIELKTGQRILFSTRTASVVRGLTIDMVVYDEAMHLSEDERSSVTPTMAAKSIGGNTQTWYTGSAVDKENPKHVGIPFAQVRLAGMEKAPNVAWFEWSCPGDDPSRVTEAERNDLALIGEANPGKGIRISDEWIEHEREVELGPRGFAVERMGIGDWPDPTGMDERPINPKDWAECADPASVIQGRVCAAYDVNPDRSKACVAVAGWRADGKAHVEVVEHKRGVDWVPDVLERLQTKSLPASIVTDTGGPSAALLPDLANKHVLITPIGVTEHAQACGIIFDAVAQRELAHLGTEELREAVGGAIKRPVTDRWLWSRKDSTTDICPLVAVTLALWAAQALLKGDPQVINLNDF